MGMAIGHWRCWRVLFWRGGVVVEDVDVDVAEEGEDDRDHMELPPEP